MELSGTLEAVVEAMPVLLSVAERLIVAIAKLCEELGCAEEEAVSDAEEEEEDVPMEPDLPEEKEPLGLPTGRRNPEPSAWFLRAQAAPRSQSQASSRWISPTLLSTPRSQ